MAIMADDAAAEAALVSQAVGAPVRLQWMRQEEHGWEPLGGGMAHTMDGAVQGGAIRAWQHTVYTPTHNARPGGNAGNTLPGQDLGFLPSNLPKSPIDQGTRNCPVVYTFPSQVVANHVRVFNTGALGTSGAPAQSPLTWIFPRTTALRTLGGFSNSFANESFFDELGLAAQGANYDPVALRLDYLTETRAIGVINAMAQQAGWSTWPMPSPGPSLVAGRGVAFVKYELAYTYVAAYVEVQVNTSTGAIYVNRVVVAHGCGLIINSDGLRNQIEGNVMQGISRTLYEQVKYSANGVTSILWSNPPGPNPPHVAYPVAQFTDAPASVEIVLIDQQPYRPGVPASRHLK